MKTTTDTIGSASLKPAGNAKRTLTRRNMWKTLGGVAASAPALARGLVRPTVKPALREKIMLEVTAINGCRYCEWGHTHLAVAHGVPLEEINQIFGYQHESLRAKDMAEAAAILFAQHYAESLDQIDPGSLANLRTYYSDAQVGEIIAYVRAITLGNLTGNTLDSFLDHLLRRGHAERGGIEGSTLARAPSASVTGVSAGTELGAATPLMMVDLPQGGSESSTPIGQRPS